MVAENEEEEDAAQFLLLISWRQFHEQPGDCRHHEHVDHAPSIKVRHTEHPHDCVHHVSQQGTAAEEVEEPAEDNLDTPNDEKSYLVFWLPNQVSQWSHCSVVESICYRQ